MATPDRQESPEIKRSEQAVQNWSFDEVYKVLSTVGLGEYAGALYRLQVDASGNLKTSASIDTTGLATSAKQDTGNASLLSIDAKLTDGSQQTQGSVASAATDSGNPIKIGAKYNATAPTFTDGQRGDAQIDSRGNIKVGLYANNTQTTASFKADNADGDTVSSTANKMAVTSRGTVYNGTSWDRMPGDTTGVKIQDGGNSITVDQSTATNLKTQAENYQGGTAVGSSNPLQVTLANTGANSTAVKVDGSAVTQPVSLASVPSHNVTNAGTFAVQSTEVAPTTVYNGKKTVTTAGTRVTLASSTTVKSVTIKALSTNTGLIYVGDTSVASTNGFQLSAGETISMDIANLNTVNLDSSVSGESVTYIGVA